MSVKLSSNVEKRNVGAADNYWPLKFKKGESPNSGQLFNTTTVDKVRSEKWPAVSLYLDELLGSKTVNSEIRSEDRSSYLERYSPKGSCHLDESSMSHSLAQNCHCEFVVECILRAKIPTIKWYDEDTYIYIYISKITGDDDDINQQRYNIDPPSCLCVVGHGCHTPLQIKKFYISTDGTHTHTHPHTLPEAGWFACNEVKMRMKRGMKMR